MRLLVFLISGLLTAGSRAAETPMGIFEGQSDIGAVAHPGSVRFDEAKRLYLISSSGANMWAGFDEFHFVWKKIAPGDVSITAGVAILTAQGNNHRKGVLMLRQSLDSDSAYVGAALHGDGLASIQSRPEKGGNTYEVQSNRSKPGTLRLVKRGEYVYLFTGASAADLQFSGGSMRVKWTEPFYVGIGACAHDKEAMVEVAFEHVHIDRPAPSPDAGRSERFSTIETVPFPSGDRRAIYATRGTLRGPVWDRDGASLIVSRDGRIERVPIASGRPVEPIATGNAPWPCDGFHGVSPDGKLLALSCGAKPSVYVVKLDGSNPALKRITHKIPTLFHSWSPDGRSLLYGIERRPGKHDFDRIASAGGGKEMRLTSNGVSENPEFSPDGKFIYFNSARGADGTMQIWRMPATGSGPAERITSGESDNWYPHLSPDGRRILMLSCDKSASLNGPPEDREVMLRVYTPETGKFQVVARILIGGRGTIDSPCWSPDGRRIAFVTYQFLPVNVREKGVTR